MNPTPGSWTYSPDARQVEHLGVCLAELVTESRSAVRPELTPDESHANGYLMASAPALRDELTNLSRAVRAYLDADINDDDEDEHCYNQMEVMLRRAERALATIFPPEAKS